MLTKEAGQLALAEAMNLHNERVRMAIEDTRRLRSELEEAEAHQQRMMKAKEAFVQAVRHG